MTGVLRMLETAGKAFGVWAALLLAGPAEAGSADPWPRLGEEPALTCLAAALSEGSDAEEAEADQGVRTAQYCPYGVAFTCQTPFGVCGLAQPLCRGQPCYCPTYAGPVWGTAN